MAKPIINLTQVDQDYDYAWVNVEFYWPSGYWGGMPFDLYMNDLLFNNENWNIDLTTNPAIISGQFAGWNKRWDGGATYGNTTRRLIPWRSTKSTAGETGVNKSLGARAWLATDLQASNPSRGRLLERVKVHIGVGDGRSNTRVMTVKNLQHNGLWDNDYCNYNVITLRTKEIPAPPTPTLTVSYHEVVDENPTILRLTANVGTNEAGFFTLRIEELTNGVVTLKETKGAKSISYDIPINEAYYDKNFSYRARVLGADIDKVSAESKVYVEYPILPLWYYMTAEDKVRLGRSGDRYQVKRAYYYDNNGYLRGIKLLTHNIGGVFVK